jgi:formylglycine-generating enzyme required for sulfatase activity/serine/threonine protein kinase
VIAGAWEYEDEELPGAHPMPVTTLLFAYGLRQVLGITEESASCLVEGAGQAIEASGTAGKIISLVRRHFTDHSQALPRALGHANERAWQALAVSLAGDGLLDRVKALITGPAPQAVQAQVKAFLAHNARRYDTTSEEMRRACLAELHQARKKGLLSAMSEADEIARQAAAYQGLANPTSLLADARQAASGVADALPAEYANLARLLRQGAGEGQPPLLVVAFAHFFRREIQTNEELARGLTFDLLQRLAENQESALSEVGQALDSLSGRFDDLLGEMLEQLGRMDAKLDDIRERLEDLARRHDVQRESSKSRFQITITNEREQALARALLEEVRKLPPEQQSADLLTLMGDVLRAAGRFKDAQQSYTEASKHTGDKAEKAASLHKAYLTALEQRRWDEALQAITEAATLEPQKYAPFPLHQYQPKRILGAGGFGAVFLCQDRYMRAEVVVKGLHNAEMERSLEEAFSEAHTLRYLSREHPSIIGVQHCSYTDEAQTRPYIVMDYFPGVSLQAYLDDLGDKPLPLEDFLPIAWQIAVGMKAAHGKSVLHRDLKPDNVLVRKGEDGWQVRIIDFGLAIRTRVVQVSTSVPSQERTLSGESAAGTAKYASPEQMGELPGVKVGPYSDVYAFGKLCCYALFRETEPLPEHWTSISEELMQMLSKCLSKRLDKRYQDFEPILAVLQRLEQAAMRKREGEEKARREEGERRLAQMHREALDRFQGKHTADVTVVSREYGIPDQRGEAIRQEVWQQWQQEHQDRHRKKAQLQQEGETRLRQLHREALDRSQGKYTADVTALCHDHGIPAERADAIRQEVWQQWQKEQENRQAEAERQRRESEERERQRQAEEQRLREELRQQEQARLRAEAELRRRDQEEAERRKQAEEQERQRQETERQKRAQEAERQRVEQEQAARRKCEAEEKARREEGEGRLAQMHREALDRSQGKQPADVKAICQEYGIPTKSAEVIRQEVWQQWQKDHPAKKERQAGEVITNGLGMKFAWCPPGTFLMGSPGGQGYRDERPQHRVTLTKGFFLGVYEVTHAQWQAVMGCYPSVRNGDNRPVANVSSVDCQEFCKKLSERDGKKYRLPTEAEWEYACRAGRAAEYHTGNGEEALNQAGWYDVNSGSQTHPVGQKKANAWGLYDMHGNVWEWCQEGGREYDTGEIEDPVSNHKYITHALRGGSWGSHASNCRSACRGPAAPSPGSMGCRVVLCLD